MFHKHTALKAALLTLLSTAALPLAMMSSAQAASYLDGEALRLSRGEATSYTASLADMTHGDVYRTTHTLDWRQPTLQLWFDLPASERTSEIVLNLSADPLTRVSAGTPLQVQFNNDTPVPVMSNGRGFEATLSFDPAKGRDRRNSLRITYATPAGADCVTPEHGQWSIDLVQSTLKIAGRARTRNMSLKEVEARLSQPALSPKRIGLVAFGPNATDMQALAAQGMALRTPTLPSFSVTPRGTDFNVLMVTRDRLFDYTDDPMILDSKGPRVFVPKGRPTQLIFTAETDAEILETLKLFSTRHLPSATRPITSPGEIDMQARLDQNNVRVDRRKKLSELDQNRAYSGFGTRDWTSGTQTYRFNVTDPANTGGEILLRLSTSNDLAKTSRLRLALNGEVLGAAKLDRRRKSVLFDIEPGQLNATSNVLSLLPELDAKAGYSCSAPRSDRPSFTVRNGSRLTLKATTPSAVTELSRLTSTGSVFATSESYIALPRDARDYEASLRVLARLAKSAGQGFVQADFTRKADIRTNGHLLVIGSAATQTEILGGFSGAPVALRQAMSGQPVSGENRLRAASERFASLGTDELAVQYAAAQSEPRRVNRGGVAALYGAGQGRLIGIISSTPGESFSAAANRLVQPAHWNAIRGGVSRWDSASVLMAQTAQPAPGVNLPETGGFSLAGFDLPVFDWPDFSLPNFKKPNWEMPTITQPKWTRPELALPSFQRDTPAVKIAETPLASEPAIEEFEPVLVQNQPMTVAKRVAQTEGLRGTFQFETPDTPRFQASNLELPKMASFSDLRRGTKAKWFEAKRWTQAKIDGLTSLRTLKDVERKTKRFQSDVKPAGNGIKSAIMDRLPGKGMVTFADRTFSVYGLLLMLTFAVVVFLMSMASPSSRLGGRH